MILTASDVESLSRSLSHWEWGEYVAETFVIIACAGEWIADLEKPWLTETRKKHLQRRSTILLVAALTASLICLFRTNQLSGSVIGFLGDKAEEAGRKAVEAGGEASTALSRSEDALAKAKTAQDSLGKAEGEAKGAQTAASGALTTAKEAHKEADAFETEIQSAKKQAADITKQLAPRTLNPTDWNAIGDELIPFSLLFIGRKVRVSSYAADAEGIVFSMEIYKIFERASIDVDPAIGRMMPVGLVDTGVVITGPVNDEPVIRLLTTEIHARADTDVSAEWNDKYRDLTVAVGSKPIAGLPKVFRPK